MIDDVPKQYMTVRVPQGVADVPIAVRSSRFADAVLRAEPGDLTAMGVQVFPHGQAPARVCVALRVTDAVMVRLAEARRGAKRIGQRFSIASLATRILS